jgi:hypothetical protein
MKLIYDGLWHRFNLIQQDVAHYGTYRWTVATDIDAIQDIQDGGNPSFVFSPFLFDNSNPQQRYGELDIETSKWGKADSSSNTDWTIYPANQQVQSNHIVGAGNTWTLEWMPDHIKFSVQGPGQPYHEWVYTDTSGIPPDTGGMHHILCVWQFQDAPPLNNPGYYEAEVVLTGYTFTPYTGTQAQTQASAPTPTAAPGHSLLDMAMPMDMSLSSLRLASFPSSIPDSASNSPAANSLLAGRSVPFNMNFKWPLSL